MPNNPEDTLVSFREMLEQNNPPDGHWMVKPTHNGFVFLDSKRWLEGLGFSGIAMEIKHKMSSRAPTQEELVPLFQKFLDWLALNLPQTKVWKIEFVGCPPVPCDREVFV